MTEGTKTLRLSKVAREFNIGISTIAGYLNKKGFNVSSNPNSKITQEAYELLCKEFQSEKNLKEATQKARQSVLKRETISLDDDKKDSGDQQQEATKTPEKDIEDKEAESSSEDLIIKDLKSSLDTKSPEDIESEEIKLSGPKVVGKIDPDTIAKTETKKKAVKKEDKKKESKKPSKAKVKTTKDKEDKKDIDKTKKPDKDSLVDDKKKEKDKTVLKDKAEAKATKSEPSAETKVDKPAEKIDSTKEKKKESSDKDKSEEKKQETTLSDNLELDIKKTSEKKDKEKDDVLKTQFQKLEGPTILGKIDLPKSKEAQKKPVASSSDELRYKKRK